MRIFYIASFKKLWDEECIAQALENLGHEVIRMEEKGRTADDYMRFILKQKPDFVMFAKLLIDGDGWGLLKSLRDFEIPSVSWTFDLYCNYFREVSIPNLPFFHADWVFTTDGGNQEKFKKLGINHHCVRQGIYAPHAILGTKRPEMDYDVIFVGTHNSHYPYRTELIAFLKKNYKFKWYGETGPDELRGLELNDAYASAKIVVGDSVPSPRYWSNRLYETTGRGGFVIFPEIEGLKEEMPMIPTYKHGDLNDLKEKIDYYLKNDLERVRLQLEMFEFTKNNYTYEKRCQTILDTIGGGIKESKGGKATSKTSSTTTTTESNSGKGRTSSSKRSKNTK